MLKTGFRALSIGLLALLGGCTPLDHRPESPSPKALPPVRAEAPVHLLFRQTMGSKVPSALCLDPAVDQNGSVTSVNSQAEVKQWDESGQLRFKIQHDRPLSAQPIWAGERLILVDDQGRALAYHRQGKVQWIRSLRSDLSANPAVNDAQVLLLLADGSALALDARTGQEQWRRDLFVPDLEWGFVTTPLWDSRHHHWLVGTSAGEVFAIQAKTGQVAWHRQVAESHGYTELTQLTAVVPHMAFYGNQVIVATQSGPVSSLRRQDGRPLWSFNQASTVGVGISPEAVLVVERTGTVYALDGETGRLQWTHETLRGRRLSQPVWAKTHWVLGDEKGYVHFLNAKGEYVAHERVRGRVCSAPVLWGERLYVFTQSADWYAYRWAP